MHALWGRGRGRGRERKRKRKKKRKGKGKEEKTWGMRADLNPVEDMYV